MNKGKLKSTNKYFSVMFVPHSDGNVRAFKFKALYSKLLLLAAIFILLVTALVSITAYVVNTNRKLTADRQELEKANSLQKIIIDSKIDEIQSLAEKDEEREKLVQDYLIKFKEMNENYLNEDAKSTRGVPSSRLSFVGDMKELKSILDKLDNTGEISSSAADQLKTTENKINEFVESTPTLWPVKGKISSPFGGRKDPFTYASEFHSGIDIEAYWGTDIAAAAAGTVTFSGYTAGYGYTVIIDHGNGVETLYGHASKLIAAKGKTVTKGEIIAKVGSSGYSTGSHLHFEVTVNGTKTDPLKYLDSK